MNTGVGCRFLLQGIFPTQGSNLGLLHCRQILYRLSHQRPKSGIEWGKRGGENKSQKERRTETNKRISKEFLVLLINYKHILYLWKKKINLFLLIQYSVARNHSNYGNFTFILELVQPSAASQVTAAVHFVSKITEQSFSDETTKSIWKNVEIKIRMGGFSWKGALHVNKLLLSPSSCPLEFPPMGWFQLAAGATLKRSNLFSCSLMCRGHWWLQCGCYSVLSGVW